jgi:predicted phage terminase large subunit-like protein
MAEATNSVRAQPGPQEKFMASSADVCIYGGAAGGGKTYALTMESGRHVHRKGFAAIVFRRLSTQITGGGSVWEEAMNILPIFGGVPREHRLDWRFPSGAIVEFSHLQYKKDVLSHQSKQYALIIFDQLEQFEEDQFWFMLARNRSVCGVRSYIRAAANPDPDGFLYRNGEGLIAWWIGEDGFPIPERSGVVRWFVRDGDELIWGDSKKDVQKKAPQICAEFPDAPISITFIAARLEDNPALMQKDPQYKAKLMALQKVQRERLMLGNWKVKPGAGMYFRRSYFEFVDEAPKDVVSRVRAWDKAATKPSAANPDPDWTVGVKYSTLKDGRFCIEHVERGRESPLGVERMVKNTAKADGKKVKVGLWQDPGGDGKAQAQHYVRLLLGFVVKVIRAAEDKETYAEPVSSQAEAGNILIVRGPWNDAFLTVLEGFPDLKHKDDVDALSLAHMLCSNNALDRLRRLATK